MNLNKNELFYFIFLNVDGPQTDMILMHKDQTFSIFIKSWLTYDFDIQHTKENFLEILPNMNMKLMGVFH